MAGQVRFLHAGHLQPDPAWRLPAHFHPFHELILLWRGRMTVRAAGKELSASAGDVLFCPAHAYLSR